jgi:hypothetical protein
LIWCTIGPKINHRAQINLADSSGHRTHELIVVEDVRGTRERHAGAEGAGPGAVASPKGPVSPKAPVNPKARSVRALEG